MPRVYPRPSSPRAKPPLPRRAAPGMLQKSSRIDGWCPNLVPWARKRPFLPAVIAVAAVGASARIGAAAGPASGRSSFYVKGIKLPPARQVADGGVAAAESTAVGYNSTYRTIVRCRRANACRIPRAKHRISGLSPSFLEKISVVVIALLSHCSATGKRLTSHSGAAYSGAKWRKVGQSGCSSLNSARFNRRDREIVNEHLLRAPGRSGSWLTRRV